LDLEYGWGWTSIANQQVQAIDDPIFFVGCGEIEIESVVEFESVLVGLKGSFLCHGHPLDRCNIHAVVLCDGVSDLERLKCDSWKLFLGDGELTAIGSGFVLGCREWVGGYGKCYA
jgi:hypothetical protein